MARAPLGPSYVNFKGPFTIDGAGALEQILLARGFDIKSFRQAASQLPGYVRVVTDVPITTSDGYQWMARVEWRGGLLSLKWAVILLIPKMADSQKAPNFERRFGFYSGGVAGKRTIEALIEALVAALPV